jgi:tetratricopeptide (TPR) repeat protein
MTRLGCLLLVLLLAACASNPEPRAPLSLSATAMRAETYLKQGQLLDALPLYEELSAREPKNPLYAERLAFCLIARSETTPTGPERTALVARARSEAERAKKLGNNSNILGTILERTNNPAAVVNRYDESLQAAEEMFVKGDMDGALAAYEKIAASDPKSYAARVYAGDVYYRKQDFRKAAEWFQKAIDVDPNYETAYRYWGDSLMAAGDSAAALQKFVDAVIAEPYNGNSWRGSSAARRRQGARGWARGISVDRGES